MGCTSSKPTAGAVCVASNKPVGAGKYEVEKMSFLLMVCLCALLLTVPVLLHSNCTFVQRSTCRKSNTKSSCTCEEGPTKSNNRMRSRTAESENVKC